MDAGGVARALHEIHHVRAHVGIIAICWRVGAIRQGASNGYWNDSSADAGVMGLADTLVVIWLLSLLVGSAARAAVWSLISDWDDEFCRVGVPLVVQLSWWITGGQSRVIAP